MSEAKKTAVEVLAPTEQMKAMNAVSRATMLTGLSPWDRHKIEWQVRRQRGQLISKLAEVEAQTVVTEAIQASEGRLDVAQEQAVLAVFEEQMRCLIQAGHLRDDTMIEAMQLSEGSREIIAGAIDRVTGRYISRMERRAAGGSCAS